MYFIIYFWEFRKTARNEKGVIPSGFCAALSAVSFAAQKDAATIANPEIQQDSHVISPLFFLSLKELRYTNYG